MGDDLDSVGEHHTCDQLWQLVVAVEAAPTFLRGLDELEDHRERGVVREAALRADRAVSHRGERLSIGFVPRKCFQCSAGKS